MPLMDPTQDQIMPSPKIMEPFTRPLQEDIDKQKEDIILIRKIVKEIPYTPEDALNYWNKITAEMNMLSKSPIRDIDQVKQLHGLSLIEELGPIKYKPLSEYATRSKQPRKSSRKTAKKLNSSPSKTQKQKPANHPALVLASTGKEGPGTSSSKTKLTEIQEPTFPTTEMEYSPLPLPSLFGRIDAELNFA